MNEYFKSLKPLSEKSGRIIIAGPCSAESEEQVMATARALAAGGVGIFRAGVWKPRTMPGGFEGRGAEALPWLTRVKRETGMEIATEVATAEHVEAALSAGVDILWIGARTVANPFAVQEIADALAAATAKPTVLVKNPVSPDINLWIGALQRIYTSGVRRLGAVHRGFTEYYTPTPYRNEPHWRIPFELRRRVPQMPLLCDPSHIAGARALVPQVATRAIDMGFDGLIIESHCSPCDALSDASQQLPPEELIHLIKTLPESRTNATTELPLLEEMRCRLDLIDDEMLRLLATRMEISAEIGKFKKAHGMTALQPARYTSMVDKRLSDGAARGLGKDFLRGIWAAIHEESVRRQIDEMSK